MVFKRRKNIPFKYVRFGSMHHEGHKKSPYLNPNSTIKRLIDIDKFFDDYVKNQDAMKI